MSRGPSEAWVEAVHAIGAVDGRKPLPPGITVAETPDWKLAVNNGSDPAMYDGVEVEPFGVIAQHKEYVVIIALGPSGGCIGGGMEEAEFIAQMQALALAPVDRNPKGGNEVPSRSDESAVPAKQEGAPTIPDRGEG